MPTNPTNATDAVQRDGVQSVRAALLYRDAFFPHRDYDQEEVEPRHGHIIWADLRALLARLADVEAENARLTERLAAASGWAEDEEMASLRAERDALLARSALVDAMMPCFTNKCDHYEWADCGQAMVDAFNASPLASAARATEGTRNA